MPINTLPAANCIDMELAYSILSQKQLTIPLHRRCLVAAGCVLDTQHYLRPLFIGLLTSLLHRALTAVGLPGAWFVTWKYTRLRYVTVATCHALAASI